MIGQGKTAFALGSAVHAVEVGLIEANVVKNNNLPNPIPPDPEEVAHATLNLCLPASSYMNAVVYVVDGGMTAKND